jgi:hypothetical protein
MSLNFLLAIEQYILLCTGYCGMYKTHPLLLFYHQYKVLIWFILQNISKRNKFICILLNYLSTFVQKQTSNLDDPIYFEWNYLWIDLSDSQPTINNKWLSLTWNCRFDQREKTILIWLGFIGYHRLI